MNPRIGLVIAGAVVLCGCSAAAPGPAPARTYLCSGGTFDELLQWRDDGGDLSGTYQYAELTGLPPYSGRVDARDGGLTGALRDGKVTLHLGSFPATSGTLSGAYGLIVEVPQLDGTIRSATCGQATPADWNNATATLTKQAAGDNVLDCSGAVAVDAVAPLQVVLGVVALPASPRYPALQTFLSGHGNGPLRLFAKTGLLFRPGTTFELIVPARFTSRLSIGWGAPSRRVEVSNCASPGGRGWLTLAGGYWIDHPACVPIIVRAGGKQQQVHIGLGTACPGQRPPQGPSQS